MTHKKALDAARILKEYCKEREKKACNNCIFSAVNPIIGRDGVYIECMLEREPYIFDIEAANKNKIKIVVSC